MSASQDARIATLESSVNILADAVKAFMAQQTVSQETPVMAPVASTSKTGKPLARHTMAEQRVDVSAQWRKDKNALRKARKTAIDEHGPRSQQAIDATVDYRDHFVAGERNGFWKPNEIGENGIDLSGFWASTVLGTWASYVRGTPRVDVQHAKAAPKMPVSDPTGQQAVANVSGGNADKSAHMARVQASIGHCKTCRDSIVAGLPVKPDLCDGEYTTVKSGKVKACRTMSAYADSINTDVPETEKETYQTAHVVNLDENDAMSESDRVAAFMATLSPAMRERMMDTATAMEF